MEAIYPMSPCSYLEEERVNPGFRAWLSTTAVSEGEKSI